MFTFIGRIDRNRCRAAVRTRALLLFGALFCVAVSAVLAGCGGGGGNDDPTGLVGRWRLISLSTVSDTLVCPAEGVCGRDDGVEFRRDGTFTNTFSGGQSVSSGTWTLNGDQLRLTVTESRIDLNEDGDFNDPDEIDRETVVADVRVSLAGSDLTAVYSDPEVGGTTATLRFRRR